MVQLSLESRRQRIRAAVDRLTQGPQRRYPGRLRRQIADYAQVRMAAGASRALVVGELGVSDPTLSRLLADEAPRPRLRPVRVVADPGPATPQGAAASAMLTVRAPGGVVIEGLDVGGIVALVRALA
jgi:phytoene dehydrogenase-like protein